ncbi:MAG: transcriptional repressor LexA [Anaerolineae bacterium]
MAKLSDRQRSILTFIETFIGENGYPPTIREIGEACSISSTSVVNYNLNKLEREGYLSRDNKVSRGIKLAEENGDTPDGIVRVPVMGRIVASEPAPVPSSDFGYFGSDEIIELTRDVVGTGSNLFALQVQGDSMIDALIDDGDIIVLQPHHDVRNGDLVAVWLTDKEETTLKRFFQEKDGRIRLQPANPHMQPIYIEDAQTVEVQGRVIAVVRQP